MSRYAGDEGQGLKLAFKALGPDPALARLNKNDTSESNGGPWTPRFERLFARAGMSLDDPANIVYLRAHQGPHPEAYHREIYRRLDEALETCRTRAECRARLVEELDKIARDICTPGSKLNKLATRTP
jgi:hypothetical protein